MEYTLNNRSKLNSLLALSAGAVAFPQISDAAIIYSGEINQQVGFSSGFSQSYTIDLPGTADLQLISQSFPAMTYGSMPYNATNQVQLRGGSYARVRAYSTAGRFFAKRTAVGATWDSIPGVTNVTCAIGMRSSGVSGSVVGPGSFTNGYIAFRFQDTNSGNADRYGWAQMSMTVAEGSGPVVTLTDYAYDDSGAKISMGAIPEPSSAALAALGVLALGGVRRWRASKRSRSVSLGI